MNLYNSRSYLVSCQTKWAEIALLWIGKFLMVDQKTVWILEDDPNIADVLELILTEEGYLTRIFTTIQAFKEALAPKPAHAFIMDVMLPDGNGFDFCQVVKSNPEFSHVPVLMMSASTKFQKIAQNSAANDFIAKPFDIDKLIEKVNFMVA